MKKRILSLLLAAALLGAFCCPAAGAATLSSAKTALNDSSDNKISNIRLACDAIDGVTVEKGAYFSFNDTVGPRTSSYGYKNAKNGRGVKVTGGGVAQVASTLYLALKKMDDIEFEEKKTYGSRFSDDYVYNEKDAVMVDYKGGVDFSFYNNADAFTINLWVAGDNVRCSLVTPYGAASSGTGEGEGYASIYLSGPDALINNVTLACDSIYDTSLKYMDEFSFNDVVGPRTARYGYEKAVNGRGVKVVGGGVAQVASAVYLAVRDMRTVEILEKSSYGKNYNQEYVDSPEDAVAVDYNGDLDFRFRYTGSGTLYLYTYIEDDVLYCEAMEY